MTRTTTIGLRAVFVEPEHGYSIVTVASEFQNLTALLTLMLRLERRTDLSAGAVFINPYVEARDADEAFHVSSISYNSPLTIMLAIAGSSGVAYLAAMRALRVWERYAEVRERWAHSRTNLRFENLRVAALDSVMAEIKADAREIDLTTVQRDTTVSNAADAVQAIDTLQEIDLR
jgi:hypothetical protein